MIVFDLCLRRAATASKAGSARRTTSPRSRRAGWSNCPQCGSPEVAKAPMAPAVPRKGNQRSRSAERQAGAGRRRRDAARSRRGAGASSPRRRPRRSKDSTLGRRRVRRAIARDALRRARGRDDPRPGHARRGAASCSRKASRSRRCRSRSRRPTSSTDCACAGRSLRRTRGAPVAQQDRAPDS